MFHLLVWRWTRIALVRFTVCTVLAIRPDIFDKLVYRFWSNNSDVGGRNKNKNNEHEASFLKKFL